MESITLTRQERYDLHIDNTVTVWHEKRHGDVGDRLWVKEPWRIVDASSACHELTVVYLSTTTFVNDEWVIKVDPNTWERHSRHKLNLRIRSAYSMPRWASRCNVSIMELKEHKHDNVVGYLITLK